MADIKADVMFLPSIVWKVEGLLYQAYCTKKGPTFDLLGTKGKLKLVYAKTATGGKCYLFLKTWRQPTQDVKLRVTVALGTYFSVTTDLGDLQADKWVIWERSCTDIDNSFWSLSGSRNVRPSPDITFLYCWSHFYLKCDFTVLQSPSPQKYCYVEEFGSPSFESLYQDLKSLFDNHLMSDVILECGNKKIYAHRAVLAARSQVFAAMFRNDMAESKEHRVCIEDVEPAVLEQLVRYLYYGEASDLDSETVYKLYAAADKYAVGALKMKCGTLMINNKETCPNEVATVAESSKEVNALDSIKLHFSNIKALLGTEEWKKLSEEEPRFAYRAFQYFVGENPE